MKVCEANKTVVYRFGPNENIMGEIELNKFTKKFFELEVISGSNIHHTNSLIKCEQINEQENR